jgi:hypothetical protein
MGVKLDRHTRRMKSWLLLFVLLGAEPLYAQEAPNWRSEPAPEVDIHLAEPAPDEVVVVLNVNALGGNHAGLFAGKLLIDPAGSYLWTRGQDKTWSEPTLRDYARYQTIDGLKIRFYRFHLKTPAFAALVQRIRAAGATPPLFCASAVQNLLADIAPFEIVKRVGWTSPTALAHVLDTLTQGAGAVGECQKLDASPCK